MSSVEIPKNYRVEVYVQTDADVRRLKELAKERGVIHAGTVRISEMPLYPPADSINLLDTNISKDGLSQQETLSRPSFLDQMLRIFLKFRGR